ncbi:DNA polymerase iota-like [Oratosquilla oratoria]|uniref:DNA polymerase iota-like n=1 Tax=Oratosquilla oratoria TaxID=337810 RepID=UPI003F772E03
MDPQLDSHERTIVHVDVDCFYAQVEMVLDPSLKDKPLGIQQKNLMVTCNYVARGMGVKKSMWLKDAVKVLPELVVVDGSDLSNYRHFSKEISAVLQTFTPVVERLGLDENFVDVTELISTYECDTVNSAGHVYGDKDSGTYECQNADLCGCGCYKRIIIGSHIACEMRQKILEATGITCCAGIAHNKLLAKLVSGYHKPNDQTAIYPWQVSELMLSLGSAKSIPSIGSTMSKTLESVGISTILDLQKCELSVILQKFDQETAQRLKRLSFGIDESFVRQSGKPLSLGLEDGFKKVCSVVDVRIRYHTLVIRLLKLLQEDGRKPCGMKVTVRKYDTEKRFGHRETKQVTIPPSIWNGGINPKDEKLVAGLVDIAMKQFLRMVDPSKPFHLTLVGVGFVKFIEQAVGMSSITHFFAKRSRNEDAITGSDSTNKEDECIENHSNKECSTVVPLKMDQEGPSSEVSLSKKRKQLPSFIHEENLFCEDNFIEDNDEFSDDSEDFSQASNELLDVPEGSHTLNSSSSKIVHSEALPQEKMGGRSMLPNSIDLEVFNSLPPDIQKEILRNGIDSNDQPVIKSQCAHDNHVQNKGSTKTNSRQRKCTSPIKSQKSIDSFFKVSNLPQNKNKYEEEKKNLVLQNKCSNPDVASTSRSMTEGLDMDVFNSLPANIQREILTERKMLQVKEKRVSGDVQKNNTLLSYVERRRL